jgi:hypothetical protein
MAKSQSQEQKEYNSLLSLTQSMLGKIGDSMSEISQQSDKRNKKLQEQVSLSRQIVDSIGNEKDLEEALKKLKQQNKEITSQSFGVNESLKTSLLQQNIAMQGVVKKQKLQQDVLNRVSDITNEISDKFVGYLESIDDGLKSIPILGTALSNMFQPFKEKSERIIKAVSSRFVSGFKTSFIQSQAAGDKMAKSVGKGITGGLKSAYRTLNLLTGGMAPLILAGVALAAVIYLGVQRFKELDAAALQFRQSTGLLVSQTGNLVSNIRSVSTDFANLGASAEDIATAAADFTNEFSGLEQPSKQVLGSMIALNKNFGIGTKEASELNKIFQNIGGLTATQSQYLIGQTSEMAKMAGVAPDKVIKDMAENSEYVYRYFQGSPQELAKAAVQAAKLGTSIKEAGKVADNLLDFESSITQELEASAILGTNINLGQARYLASTNDVLGAQQAVVDEVSKLGDITQLNKWQQDALTAATGMEFESLVNQQRIRERFGKLNKEQLASAMSLVDAGKDISKLSQSDLVNQTKKLSMQKEMQSVTDDLNNEASAIGTAFMDALAPIGELVMPILRDITAFLGSILVPTFKLIGNIFMIAAKILLPIWNIFSAIVIGLADIVGSIISVISDAFGYFADLFSYINDLATKYVINPIKNFFDGIASFISGFGAVFSFNSGGSEMGSTATTSINDGVVQNGQVVSTHPEDFLIATKNPAALAESVGTGGVNISMDGVISELRELKAAFLSNRDIYMDGSRVTSLVRKTTERSTDNNFGIQNA